MKRAHAVLLVVLLAIGGASALTAVVNRQDGYPHDAHANLFPLCASCHTMDSTERSAYFPPVALCGRCHDGREEEQVSWSPPPVEPTLLVFDHGTHDTAVADEQPPLECESCHESAGRIVEATAAGCIGCHAHQAANHFTDAECSTCHVPITRATPPADLLAGMSRPADHASESFFGDHERAVQQNGQSCAYCHARQQCATCHVNAATVPAIANLPAAPASLALPRIDARYPEPASHASPDFATNHGAVASPESCSTCHARESCTTCHIGRLPEAVTAMPPRSPDGPHGVEVTQSEPVSHLGPQFITSHGNLVATEGATCTMCHTRNSCEECHSAPARAVFHPANFMTNHSAATYAARLECASCHDAKVFCRECHTAAGQVPGGQLLSAVFHDAEPLWLLRHGGAARRGLESCTSCHTQRSCLQCHSTFGAFQVNPHGRDFDAQQAKQKNPIICKACHITDPLRGG